ncbi:MAG: hypothetical protein CSYNP_02628 [Syntrophus sp. SKADARSKE-3]|nr:hypothetical protein [Syntrophus sp. SKADARSKE-3]
MPQESLSLGEKTSMEDTDRGKWSYEYDEAEI